MENERINGSVAKAEQQQLQQQLNGLLADLIVLNLKFKNYHWNLEGPSFILWHTWLDEASARLQNEADSLAERIKMRGETPKGSLVSIRQHADFDEGALLRNESQILPQLKADYQHLLQAIRETLELAALHADHGTADMLTGTLRAAEKDLWYLNASTPF